MFTANVYHSQPLSYSWACQFTHTHTRTSLVCTPRFLFIGRSISRLMQYMHMNCRGPCILYVSQDLQLNRQTCGMHAVTTAQHCERLPYLGTGKVCLHVFAIKLYMSCNMLAFGQLKALQLTHRTYRAVSSLLAIELALCVCLYAGLFNNLA